MSFDRFVTGTVFIYPYLWDHEAQCGETEGRKDRPVVVGFRLRQKHGFERIVILPITTKMPEAERFASEIPDIEKRRAGLDASLRLWIILDDANNDVLEQSYYLRSQIPLGRFSKAYFVPLMQKLISRRESISLTDRTR